MLGTRTREEYAEFNKENRLDLYWKATFWAAIGGIGPVGFFLCHNILNTPQPIGRHFLGYERDQAPMGDYREVYSYDFASSGDHALNILGFILGIFAAIAVAMAFYCLARFVADPIMYRVDLHTEHNSGLQVWTQRIIMTIVVLLYCGCMVFAYEYDAYPEDQYIWLSDGEGNEFRVSKEDYDRYMKDSPTDKEKESEAVQETTTEPATEATKDEDRGKTPVERGYPSNDPQYYIDHPDEPMPQELIDELLGPGGYNPGMDYDPSSDYY